MKREVYAKAKELLAGMVKDRDSEYGLAHLQHFYTLYFDGKEPREGGNACYSSIQGIRESLTNVDAIVSLTTHYNKRIPTMEDTGEYYAWLIKESPFSPVFKCKNTKKAVEEGIICHTTQRADLTGGALISARMAYEYPQAIRIWTKLVRGGVHPSIAYMLMMTFREDGVVNTVAPYGGGHCILPHTVYRKDVVNFIKNEPKGERDSFRDDRGYSNNTEMWRGRAGLAVGNYFSTVFNKKFQARKTLFGGVVPAGATNKQLVEEVLKYQEELFKEYKL